MQLQEIHEIPWVSMILCKIMELAEFMILQSQAGNRLPISIEFLGEFNTFRTPDGKGAGFFNFHDFNGVDDFHEHRLEFHEALCFAASSESSSPWRRHAGRYGHHNAILVLFGVAGAHGAENPDYP